MKPTPNDEILACIAQINSDIDSIADTLDYLRAAQERLNVLLNAFVPVAEKSA